MKSTASIVLTSFLIMTVATGAPVTTVQELVSAVENASDESTVRLSAGTFKLTEPLVIKSGTTLKGAGAGKTILTHVPTWKGNPATLPDPETNHQKFDKSGYLIHLADKASGITISDLTLTGPQLHGGIYGWDSDALELHHLLLEDFLYCGIRTYQTSHAKIHDCTISGDTSLTSSVGKILNQSRLISPNLWVYGSNS